MRIIESTELQRRLDWVLGLVERHHESIAIRHRGHVSLVIQPVGRSAQEMWTMLRRRIRRKRFAHLK